MFAEMLGITTDPKTMRRIPLNELTGTWTSGIPGVGHDKCNCPGFVSMLPAKDGTFKCDSCNGYATKEDSDIKKEEGLKGGEEMLRQLGAPSLPKEKTPRKRRSKLKSQ